MIIHSSLYILHCTTYVLLLEGGGGSRGDEAEVDVPKWTSSRPRTTWWRSSVLLVGADEVDELLPLLLADAPPLVVLVLRGEVGRDRLLEQEVFELLAWQRRSAYSRNLRSAMASATASTSSPT